jgi:protein O-GlcNAc transferase
VRVRRGARSDVLSLRAVAPLQVAYLGYPSTVGAFHDYLLSDRVSSPPSLAVLGYSEHLVYMPHTYQVTEHAESFALDHGADLDADAERRRAARADAGLPEHGIVFTSFNQLFRIDPRTYDVWCRLLLRVPGSVLWLVRMPDEAADNLVLEATRRGVDAGRVVFAKMVNKAEHMRRLRLADVVRARACAGRGGRTRAG